MPMTHYIMLDSYSAIVLAVIMISSLRLIDRRPLRNRLFMGLLLIILFLLPIDIFSRLDGFSSPLFPTLNQIGNFVIYLINPIVPSIWMLYVHNQIHQDELKTLRLVPTLLVPLVANTVLLILSQYFGWYYVIDTQNIYHRGPLFIIPLSMTVTLLSISFFITLWNRHKLDRRSFLSLLLFPMPLVVCIVLQVINSQLSTLVNGLAISLLIVFVNIQSSSIHTDHLTGIHNRKRLEDYLRRRISASTNQRSFAAILLDMDDFKAINDTYGHDVGDRALTDAVHLLKQCVRINDFIARYGGDEFVIVLDISDRVDLEAMADRITQSAREFNKCSLRPYQIQFSMGYAVYNAETHMTVEAFIRHIDAIMYENKQNKKTRKEPQAYVPKPASPMQSFRLALPDLHTKQQKPNKDSLT